MNTYTLEGALNTNEPDTIELLGAPNAIAHSITGTLRLTVNRPLQLKQLNVSFVGEVYVSHSTSVASLSSYRVNTCRVEKELLREPTQFQPGEHLLPFELSIPGDVASTVGNRLRSDTLLWEYLLISTATPSGLFHRRKVHSLPVQVKRLLVQPSHQEHTRFGSKRPDAIECSILAPKFVNTKEPRIPVRINMHPLNMTYIVKEILVRVVQLEKIEFDLSNPGALPVWPPGFEGEQIVLSSAREKPPPVIKGETSKDISSLVSIQNPNQETSMADWGREQPIELEVDLLTKNIQPSETLDWLQVSHAIRITIIFSVPTIKQMIIMAPFQLGRVLEAPLPAWIDQTPPGDLRPPVYGSDEGLSMLLDSNTNDLPPEYEFEDNTPQSSTEKNDL
ncbi:hypothetical protein BGW38_000981 [Lunasporangiospora selenospora]|uniref:Arrestin-like N-terminal domain-containing protein n=1 Tax=Lunasporangiospora selenospora TaxID=979761 RepID=A0A9P6G3W8_9FUNG|nr:hypothetical protein BGW38_000981 [Lunasporangiospora selenospora]